MDHEYFMKEALLLAKEAARNGEFPVGAVIVRNGEIIGRGRNRKEEKKDPSSHAEMEAIKEACSFIGDWRIKGSVIYATAEPCLMCCGAIIHARIDRVVFAAPEPKFGGVLSKLSVFDSNLFNHRVEWLSGVFEDDAVQLMKDFFRWKRR